MNSSQAKELARLCPAVQWQADMARFSSLRAGGKVEALIEVEDCSLLPALLRWLAQEEISWRILGGGSNILFTSGLHQGVFIRLRGGLEDIVFSAAPAADGQTGERLVEVQAGVGMALLLGWCLRQGLSGLEFMAGIPGTVGGAIAMNAGAYGGNMGDRLSAVRLLDFKGDGKEVPAEALHFQYRKTAFPPECCGEQCLITGATLRLQTAPAERIKEGMRTVLAQRKAKHPAGVASAGSFFKNPPGDFAGRLIEETGLKGYCHGQAMVSAKHGNFIVNRGGASPEDILALMRFVQARVHARHGVMLEPEVRFFECPEE